MITVYLKHPEVEAFTFQARHVEFLKKSLPRQEIRWCRSSTEFRKALPETETALVWYFRQEWYALAPRLRLLITPAAGRDLLGSTPPPGVTFRSSHYHGILMAETAAAMVLSSCRGLLEAQNHKNPSQTKTPWPRGLIGNRMTTLRSARVTLLGFGAIATAIARRLLPFGPILTGLRRTPASPDAPAPDFMGPPHRLLTPDHLPAVLPETDHLILILPRTKDTDNLIGPRELSLLPSHSSLYNLGRGNAVDEDALREALQAHLSDPARGIARAWLDVFREEPLPAASPLRRIPNCHILPHASAIAPDYMDLFLEELQAEGVFDCTAD